MIINPFRTAVPFWGQSSQISSSFVPKRDSGSKGVKIIVVCRTLRALAKINYIVPGMSFRTVEYHGREIQANTEG